MDGDSAVNQFLLSARIAARQATRYTPAGLPALDLTLEHESTQSEAGQTRKVQASIEAVAIGTVAEQIGSHTVGSVGRFGGFIARSGRGRQLRFHIQSFQPEHPTD